jgi:uncharacterized protein YdeI (YjbR/CyaY-like superfamily)
VSRLDTYERVEATSAAAWRDWLQRHHTRADGVWLVTWKKGRGPYVSYDAVVEEALCWGWIDGLRRPLDADRTTILMSPRKPKSAWSALNRQRVERLIADGRMQPAGLARVDAAKADGSWSAHDAREAAAMPAELDAALAANPLARANLEGFSPSARKGLFWYVASARRADTRARRVADAVRMAEQNRPPQLTRKP